MQNSLVLNRPPGPKGQLLLGSLRELGTRPLDFFVQCAREYGDLVGFQLAGRNAVLVNRPDCIEYVLVKNPRNFVKHRFFWDQVRLIFGDGLLTSEGDFWLRQRRLAAPAFHADRLARYANVMVEYAESAADRWRDGESRDAHHEMMDITLRIATKTLFGAEVDQEVQEVEEAFSLVAEEIASRFGRPFPIPDWIPLPGNVRYVRGVRRLDRIVWRLIQDRKRDGVDRGDLLSMLLAARDEHGAGMPDQLVRDEVITLLLAGHETTALALSWTWYLLSQNPRVEARLAEELRTVLGDRPPTFPDLPRLQYTEQVVTESMRLYPPAWGFGREAVGDCEIGGYSVPAGTIVFVSPWVLHHDPRHFDDPEAFRPERWADGLSQRLPRFAYLPFGGGPRVCIGNRFAMMEAVLVLATIARRFRLEWLGGAPIVPFPSITLRPQGGLPVRVSPRWPAA